MLPLENKNYLITCPMCLGKGYCDDDKPRLSYSLSNATQAYSKHSVRLPAIGSGNTNPKKYSLSYGSEFSNPAGTGDPHLPSINHSKNSLNKKNTVYPGGDNTKGPEKNLLAPPSKFERPQDALKLALLKLKENQWDTTMQALPDIVQISRFQPELIDSSMPIVNRGICSLLRNIRSNVARTACHIAAELFRTMQCTQRPDFDELVSTLLQKTADMNKSIRHDANQALDAMVDFIPASHAVRVMASSRGAGHKNPLVRATVSRLLNYIVTAIGVESFLSTTGTIKDTRSRIFVMCAKFLLDGSFETRYYIIERILSQFRNNAKTLIKLLVNHSDFEHLFNQEVDCKLLEKIKKQLVILKYETPSGGSQISK